MWEGNLSAYKAQFLRKASVVKYLVEPSYPDSGGTPQEFSLALKALRAAEMETHFSAARSLAAHVAATRSVIRSATLHANDADKYFTLGKSRVAALTAVDKSLLLATKRINEAIHAHMRGGLEAREDIGKDLEDETNAEMVA